MITVTRLNGPAFALNPDLIERVEATPDTVIHLVGGNDYVVARERRRDRRACPRIACGDHRPVPPDRTAHGRRAQPCASCRAASRRRDGGRRRRAAPEEEKKKGGKKRLIIKIVPLAADRARRRQDDGAEAAAAHRRAEVEAKRRPPRSRSRPSARSPTSMQAARSRRPKRRQESRTRGDHDHDDRRPPSRDDRGPGAHDRLGDREPRRRPLPQGRHRPAAARWASVLETSKDENAGAMSLSYVHRRAATKIDGRDLGPTGARAAAAAASATRSATTDEGKFLTVYFTDFVSQ